MPHQIDLPLPFPEFNGDQPALPVRMMNEFVYCPRLAYQEWVQGECADSADAVQGRGVHLRVDQPGGKLPSAEDIDNAKPAQIQARSVSLVSARLGLVAKLDLIRWPQLFC